MDPHLSRNVDVGAFLMARLDLLIYHCFFFKINQPTSNRRLLKVGRLIILEKSRKKKRRAGAGCGRVICHYLKAWNKLALWKKKGCLHELGGPGFLGWVALSRLPHDFPILH